MSDDLNRRPEKPAGRKRDDEVTNAILSATAELLLEVGFDRFRTQDVAERAGAGKGAIYRRWPTKEALLAEAIRKMPAGEAPDSGDPHADLRTLVADRCRSAQEQPDLVPGLISAMRGDEGISQAVRDGLDLGHVRDTVAGVVGDDHPHLEVLTLMTQAIPLMRSAFMPDSLDADAMTDEIVSLIESVGR